MGRDMTGDGQAASQTAGGDGPHLVEHGHLGGRDGVRGVVRELELQLAHLVLLAGPPLARAVKSLPLLVNVRGVLAAPVHALAPAHALTAVHALASIQTAHAPLPLDLGRRRRPLVRRSVQDPRPLAQQRAP